MGAPGTRPSGAQQRKAKAEREAIEKAGRDALAAKAAEVARESFDGLPPPPPDPVGAVAWAHQVAARLLWQTLRDPSIGEQERRRVASDLIAKIGLTAPKAIADARLRELEKRLGMAQETRDADTFDEQPAGPDRAGDDGDEPLPADDVVADAPQDEYDAAPGGG